MLCDLLSRFSDESTVLNALLGLDDLGLLVRVKRAAEAENLTLGTWTREAVGRFAATADDAQWLGLMSACSNASDPGSAALRRMLEATLGTEILAE